MNENAVCWPPSPYSHQNSVQNQISRHPRLHRPADDLSRIQVHHRSQIEPALIGPDIREISHPHTIRMIDRELPLKMVRSQNRGGSVYIPVPFIAPDGFDPVRSHDPLDAMLAAALARLAKIEKDPRTAIHTPTLCVE